VTAAELNALSAELGQAIAQAESATQQIKLRGLVNAFDHMEPLPDLHIRATRSWEPAARRYRDLTTEERAEQ